MFWYTAVLQVLPNPRASASVGGAAFLNVRGLSMPAPLSPGFGWLLTAGITVAVLLSRTLPRLPLLLTALGPLALGAGAAVATTEWDLPELLALTAGIGIYTAAFISENIRASINAVGHGQREAARSLGLFAGRKMRLVVLPQALRTLFGSPTTAGVLLASRLARPPPVPTADADRRCRPPMPTADWGCLLLSLAGSMLERRLRAG